MKGLSMSSKTNVLMYCFSALLSAALLFLLFVYIPRYTTPAEDATILYQYSENLATTGCISYIPGGTPTEGATDFLWMAAISLLHRMGIDSFAAAQVLSLLAVIATAAVLWKLTAHASGLLLFCFMIIIMMLPTTPAAIVGFSPLFFGFFIVLSIFFYINNSPGMLFFSGAVTCLVRPDGVVFVVPLMISYIISNKHELRKNVLLFLIIFAAPLTLYFVWRLAYFGKLFPLPFYVKSTFQKYLLMFHKESLKMNIKYIIRTAPLLLYALLPIIFKGAGAGRKLFLCLVSCIIIPFVFYSSMELSQNVFQRFQYPFIIVSITIAVWVYGKYSWKTPFWLTLLLSLALLSPRSVDNYLQLYDVSQEKITSLSKELKDLEPKGLLAVTEAGRLPYYSKWETIDLWGLNTPELATTLVTPAQIRQYSPDIIVIHAAYENYDFMENRAGLTEHTQRSWTNMCENAYLGIDPAMYSMRMVPFRNRLRQNGKSMLYHVRETIFAVKLKILGVERFQPEFPPYFLYAVKKSYGNYRKVMALLTQYGAISYQEFKTFKELFYRSTPEEKFVISSYGYAP